MACGVGLALASPARSCSLSRVIVCRHEEAQKALVQELLPCCVEGFDVRRVVMLKRYTFVARKGFAREG